MRGLVSAYGLGCAPNRGEGPGAVLQAGLRGVENSKLVAAGLGVHQKCGGCGPVGLLGGSGLCGSSSALSLVTFQGV